MPACQSSRDMSVGADISEHSREARLFYCFSVGEWVTEKKEAQTQKFMVDGANKGLIED